MLCAIRCVFVILSEVCYSDCSVSFSVILSFSVLFVILSVVCHSECNVSFSVLFVILTAGVIQCVFVI